MDGLLVRGVGVYHKGKYKSRVKTKLTKEYSIWQNVLRRCYSEDFHKENITYQKCVMSENFKNFQFFAGWCQDQEGFGEKDYQIDKDILGSGYEYNESVCVFVPRKINNLFPDREAARGDSPIGVTRRKDTGKFQAQMSKQGRVGFGSFSCPEEAFLVYKQNKEAYVKEMAHTYKDVIDPRVYEKLITWTVTYPLMSGNFEFDEDLE